MADITGTVQLTITKSGNTSGANKAIALNMTGTKQFSGEQDIGHADGEQVVFPADLLVQGIQGVMLYCNTSGEEIKLGLALDGSTDVTQIFARVKYGGIPLCIQPGTTVPVIYAQATSTTAKLQIVAAGV